MALEVTPRAYSSVQGDPSPGPGFIRHICQNDVRIKYAAATFCPTPPAIVSHAQEGYHRVAHHEIASISRNANGNPIATALEGSVGVQSQRARPVDLAEMSAVYAERRDVGPVGVERDDPVERRVDHLQGTVCVGHGVGGCVGCLSGLAQAGLDAKGAWSHASTETLTSGVRHAS